MKLTKLSLGLLLSLIPLCLALIIRVFSLSPEENSPMEVNSDSLVSMAIKSEEVPSVQTQKVTEEKQSNANPKDNPREATPKLVETTPEELVPEKAQELPKVDSQITQLMENQIPSPEEIASQKLSQKETLPKEENPAQPSQPSGFNTGVYQQEEVGKKEPEVISTSSSEFRALIQGKKVQQGSLIQVVLQEDIPQYNLQAGTYLQAECEFRNQRLQLSITQAKINGRFKRIKLIGYDTKDGIMGITQPGISGGLPSEWVIPNGHPLHLRFD
ncbi:MAG: conjugative transposon protein TraM [Bacteroidota bacterium]